VDECLNHFEASFFNFKIMSKKLNLVGQRFGRLIVLKPSQNRGKHLHTCWKCRCDCGNEKIILTSSLRGVKTKSCGCLNIEGNNTKHGMCGTKFYNTWLNMKQRCNNPNSTKYKIYGKRGIKVCDRWLESFENFKDDMLSEYLKHSKKYGEKNTTIDRKDNMENYSLSNCHFATQEVQSNNRRSNHLLTYKGKTMNIKYWAKFLNIRYTQLSSRLRNGWSMEKIENTPIRIGNYKKKN